MAWKILDDMDLAGKIVLTRVDINVPVEDGRVTRRPRGSSASCRRSGTSSRKAARRSCWRISGGPRARWFPRCRCVTCCPALEDALGMPVTFCRDAGSRRPGGPAAGQRGPAGRTRGSTQWKPRTIRSWHEFLASLGDVYCNDAFSAAHRAHASTEGGRPSPALLRRAADGGRTDRAGEGAGPSGTSRSGRGGRRQGLHQARPAGQPDRQGRHAGDRWRHGQHVSRGTGDRRGRLAVRARSWRHRAGRSSPGPRNNRLRGHPAHGCGRRAGVRSEMPRMRPSP